MFNFELEVHDELGTFTFTHIGIYLNIGRKSGHLLLQNPSISDIHCSLLLTPNSSLLIDHHSRTGTFLNEKIVGRTPIQENDTIKIGIYKIHVKKIKGLEHFPAIFQNREIEDIYQWIVNQFLKSTATT